MKVAWYVDDDEEMINAISLMMELLEYDVRAYLNAPEAVRDLLEGAQPDLMLLDINMPEVSGIDMLEFIRRKPQFNDLPIIILSSEAADIQIDEAFARGADAYVCKPVTLDELEAAIRDAYQARLKS